MGRISILIIGLVQAVCTVRMQHLVAQLKKVSNEKEACQKDTDASLGLSLAKHGAICHQNK